MAGKKGMTDRLSNYIDITNGVPCERTFKNISNSVKPETMENALLDLGMVQMKVTLPLCALCGLCGDIMLSSVYLHKFNGDNLTTKLTENTEEVLLWDYHPH